MRPIQKEFHFSHIFLRFHATLYNTYASLTRVSLRETPTTELTMNKNIITYLIISFAVLSLGGSMKMLSAVDSMMLEEMTMPASISLNIEEVNFDMNEADFTRSQYCSKDSAFTFFFATTFPNAFTLRMVVDSEEPFKLNHRYEIPFGDSGKSLAGLQNYNFAREDDFATAGWIEFTRFEKEGGILTRDGEVRCAIEGRFGFTATNSSCPESSIEVTEGTFSIPEAQYCDLRTIKE